MAKTNRNRDGDDSPQADLDAKTLAFIDSIASRVREAIARGELPTIDFFVRSLSNVSYDPEKGYLELGDVHKSRTLTVNTIRSFAQTLRLMATSRDMVRSNDFATKREAYYVSKNWGDCRFDDQPESDAIMDDIEALASLHGLSREQLRFYADSHGGSVAGELVVIDPHPAAVLRWKLTVAISARGAYSIPRSVEQLALSHECRVCAGHRDGGHVPAPEQPPILDEGQLHSGRDGRRSDAGHPSLPAPAHR